MRRHRAARPGAAVPPAQPRALPARAQDDGARRRDRGRRRGRRGRGPRPRVPRRQLLRRRRPHLRTDLSPCRTRCIPRRTAQVAEPQEQARSRDPRAARGGAAARPQVRRSGAALAGAGDRALRRRAGRRGAADGPLMHDAYGIGLAATQVGVMHRAARLPDRARRVGRGAREPGARVVAARRRRPPRRAACRFPGVGVEVERPVHVRVRAQDERGEPILVEASAASRRG